MHKFREGDRVSIEAVIASDFVHDGKTKVRIEPYHEIYVKVADLTMVKPTFAVGDRVTWSTHCGADSAVGDVLSIAQDHLWVDLGAGNYATVWTGKAMRVDPEPAEQTTPVEEAA